MKSNPIPSLQPHTPVIKSKYFKLQLSVENPQKCLVFVVLEYVSLVTPYWPIRTRAQTPTLCRVAYRAEWRGGLHRFSVDYLNLIEAMALLKFGRAIVCLHKEEVGGWKEMGMGFF